MSGIQTIRVEVGVELMKFVLGYDLVNLKELREKFPTLKINNGKRAIYIEGCGAVQLDKCKKELDDIIVRAMTAKQNASYKKRIEKEIESKRRVAAAANRIRDNIESELKTKHINDISEKISKKMGINSVKLEHPLATTGLRGMFSGLEIEDSGDEYESC